MTHDAPPAPRAPSRLAHIALRTNQLDAMVDWYCQVLGCRIAHRSSKVAFLTYDDEHHRIALLAFEPFAPKATQVQVGFAHVAFAYDSLADLLGTYRRLLAAGIQPARAINHGPTVSFYYADPDGNHVEIQVDSFPDAAATNAWMESEAFRKNPIGVVFDPEDMLARLNAGTPEQVLMRRPDTV